MLVASPAKIGFPLVGELLSSLHCSWLPEDVEALKRSRLLQTKKSPPSTPERSLASFDSKTKLNPRSRANMTIVSAIIWPRTTSGPAIDPLFVDHATVATNIGPGGIAPENPIMKEAEARNISSSMLSIQPSRGVDSLDP